MFEKVKTKLLLNRVVDEQIYEEVAIEMAEGNIRKGLWAKATEDANGNIPKIESLYIKYRVQSILDEIKISDHTSNANDIEYTVKTSVTNKVDNTPISRQPKKVPSKEGIDTTTILGFACIAFVVIVIIFSGK